MTQPQAAMTLRPLHALLLLVVTFIWGSNFVVINVGLRGFDPLLLATLRFAFSAFPLIFLRRRPPIALHWFALNGLAVGVGQFGILFLAMKGDVAPGLASLLMQIQVFITVVLAALVFHERVGARAVWGLSLGAAGLVIVAVNLDASITWKGLVMLLAATTFWALSNVLTQYISRGLRARTERSMDMLGFVAWSSLFAVPPLAAMSWAFEGAGTIGRQLAEADLAHWAAALWQAIGNMLIGFAAWYAMLARYNSAIVVPWALLVPVFGIACAVVFEGEAMPLWKIIACALVMAGLAVANGLFARAYRILH